MVLSNICLIEHGVTPFMPVYGSEVVLLVDIELLAMHLVAAARLLPDHEDYEIECIASL